MRMIFQAKTPILDRAEKNLNNLNLTSIGNVGVADVKRNFTTRGSNIGAKWPSLKFRDGQPLRDNSNLYGSIHFRQVGNTVYIIASRTEYNKKTGRRVNIAQIQNEGWKIKVTPKMRAWFWFNFGIRLKKTTTHIEIPKREFMRFSKAARYEFTVLLGEAILR